MTLKKYFPAIQQYCNTFKNKKAEIHYCKNKFPPSNEQKTPMVGEKVVDRLW